MAAAAKGVMVLGVILLVAGLGTAIWGFSSAIKDPSKEARQTLDFPTTTVARNVSLDSGDYELWYESRGGLLSLKPVIVITDSMGLPVYTSSVFSGSESVTVNGQSYHKLGSFKISRSGSYNVTTTWACTLYFTPPLDIGTGVTIGFSGILVLVVGVIVMAAGGYLHYRAKHPKPARPQAQAPAAYPGQYPGQYPAQYPPGYPGQPPQYPGYQPPPPPGQQPQPYPGQYPAQYPPGYPGQPPQYPGYQPPPQPGQQPQPYPGQQPPSPPGQQPPSPPGQQVPSPPGQQPQPPGPPVPPSPVQGPPQQPASK